MSGRKGKRNSRINANGRASKQSKHLRLYWWTFESVAYRSLGCVARCLLAELVFAHDGANNGDIKASYRWARDRLGVGSFATVQKAFGELLDRGFIKIAKEGSFDWKSGARNGEATRWTVTLLEGPNGEQPTKDFMTWRPPDAAIIDSEKKSTATERVAHRYRACSRQGNTGAKTTKSATERVAVGAHNQQSTATERVTRLVNQDDGVRNNGRKEAESTRAVADRIREARKALAWTQRGLAERASTHQPVISKIERGNFHRIGPATVARVARAVGVEIGAIQ